MASRGVEALSDRELLPCSPRTNSWPRWCCRLTTVRWRVSAREEEARLRMVGGLGLKRARMLPRRGGIRPRLSLPGVPKPTSSRRAMTWCGSSARNSKRSRMKSAGPFTSPLRTGSSNVTASVGGGDRHGRRSPADYQTGFGTACHTAYPDSQPPFPERPRRVRRTRR